MLRYNSPCTSTSNAWQVSPCAPQICRVTLKIVVGSSGRGRTEPLTASQILGCSAMAKMTASIVTYPHEVVRTRFQTEKRLLSDNGDGPERARPGLIRTTKHIVTHEGWRALYRGLSVNLVRTVPNSAVTMLTCVSLCLPLS